MGNIRSIQNALNYLGIKNQVIDKSKQVLDSEKLILPGVGSFRLAMENMNKKNFVDPLNKAVLEKKTPILGICLGMQLMSEQSEEDGSTKGFGWIRGTIKKFDSEKLAIKVPHVGFNTLFFEKGNDTVFKGLGDNADYYYVHSYRLSYDDCDAVSGWSEYGEKIVGSIEKDNIFGTQFHPEKSQSNGLIYLKNFAEI